MSTIHDEWRKSMTKKIVIADENADEQATTKLLSKEAMLALKKKANLENELINKKGGVSERIIKELI